MADHTLFLHDDILCNILARLPAKPLLRFRCVSTHWNRMLRRRSFMKLRSRRALILPLVKTLLLIDHNDNSVVPRPYPLEFHNHQCEYRLGPIGTINGLILFIYIHDLILYNPFTRLFRTLPPIPPAPLINCFPQGALGFGCSYGDARDLKVIRFRQYRKICYVFSLKEGSWSTVEYNNDVVSIFQFDRRNVAGTHANGFLYWIACRKPDSIIALNVKDMVLSEMSHLPFKKPSLLGTINGGCNLCALDKGSMWVMKEQYNQWSKMYSFQVRIPNCYTYLPLSVLDSGKILMMIGRSTRNLIIYDPINNSYKKLDNISLKDNDCYRRMHVLEYVESMVSPVYIMSRSWRSRVRKEEADRSYK